jgi:hypothetical protein
MPTLAIIGVALLIPAASFAQLGGPSGSSTAIGAAYGNGVQAMPTYAGTIGPSNVLLLRLNSVASYDSKVLRISG